MPQKVIYQANTMQSVCDLTLYNSLIPYCGMYVLYNLYNMYSIYILKTNLNARQIKQQQQQQEQEEQQGEQTSHKTHTHTHTHTLCFIIDIKPQTYILTQNTHYQLMTSKTKL
jgi:Ca2+/Na+ antiporter